MQNAFLILLMLIIGFGLAINPFSSRMNSNLFKCITWMFAGIFKNF